MTTTIAIPHEYLGKPSIDLQVISSSEEEITEIRIEGLVSLIGEKMPSGRLRLIETIWEEDPKVVFYNVEGHFGLAIKLARVYGFRKKRLLLEMLRYLSI